MESLGGQGLTISGNLLHKLLHRLQLVLSYIEMAELMQEPKKRKGYFDRARQEIDDLGKLLKENARGKP
jgi:hypothetical protein